MVSLFLVLGCNLSYIVDLFAALHELASASARTLLKLTSSVRALLKPYGDTLNQPITFKVVITCACARAVAFVFALDLEMFTLPLSLFYCKFSPFFITPLFYFFLGNCNFYDYLIIGLRVVQFSL